MPASAQTISVSRGKTAIEHDLREYTPNNVEASMSMYNVVLIDELNGKSLAEYTNEYMKPYIEEYNEKQRRSDRRKSYDYAADYIEEQNNMQKSRQNYTAGQLAYEYVIQFGDHQTMNVNEVVKDNELRKDVLMMFEEFIQSYQSSYPHMRIILATVHMDEPKGTPHMHILVQPIGEGYKQGLSHQVSLTKALACDGFERSEKKGERLSMTRWQDDIKDNIMEPILMRHKYTRAYKDGEKYHMPVAMYKRAMEEKETIVEGAKAEAEQIVDEAYDELVKIAEEKDQIINGNGMSGRNDVPYEEWSLEDLANAHKFYVESCDGETNIEYMSVPQLEKVQKELVTNVKGKQKEYEELSSKYVRLRDGYVNAEGRRIMGYHQLVDQYKKLMEEPEYLLETEVGQKVLADAEERIVEKVQKSFFKKMLGFVRTDIFDLLKEYLVDPLYKAIGDMTYEHSLRLNSDDEKLILKAIDESVDTVVEELDIGNIIQEDMQMYKPTEEAIIREVVQQRMRHRGR